MLVTFISVEPTDGRGVATQQYHFPVMIGLGSNDVMSFESLAPALSQPCPSPSQPNATFCSSNSHNLLGESQQYCSIVSHHVESIVTLKPTEVSSSGCPSQFKTYEFRSTLQKQAIERAHAAFSRLPRGDAIFQQCITSDESVVDVVKTIKEDYQSYKIKKSTQLLERFQKHTLWLQNISGVVDVAVQTQASIACPVWAPIKFVLKVRSYQYTDTLSS